MEFVCDTVSKNAFSSSLSTTNLKLFPNYSGICSYFERKFNKIIGDR